MREEPGGRLRSPEMLLAEIRSAFFASLPAACGLLAVLAAGCDGRVAECNDLIGIINAEQTQLKALDRSDPKALEQLADRVDATVDKLDDAGVEIGQLADLRADYKEMCVDLAAAARSIAKHLKAGDKDKAAEAAEQLRAMSRRENQLVNAINTFCQGG